VWEKQSVEGEKLHELVKKQAEIIREQAKLIDTPRKQSGSWKRE
jgi:hypothetical protein